MKPNWAFCLATTLFLLSFFVIGVPISFSHSDVIQAGSDYQIVTPHQTLAKLIGSSSNVRLLCQNQDRCLTPVDRRSFMAHVPIVFEECDKSQAQLLCDDLKMKFHIKTSSLISVGFQK